MDLWCINQWIDENGKVACLAHLAEARVFDCRYDSPEDRLKSNYPCSDYKPKKD